MLVKKSKKFDVVPKGLPAEVGTVPWYYLASAQAEVARLQALNPNNVYTIRTGVTATRRIVQWARFGYGKATLTTGRMRPINWNGSSFTHYEVVSNAALDSNEAWQYFFDNVPDPCPTTASSGAQYTGKYKAADANYGNYQVKYSGVVGTGLNPTGYPVWWCNAISGYLQTLTEHFIDCAPSGYAIDTTAKTH